MRFASASSVAVSPPAVHPAGVTGSAESRSRVSAISGSVARSASRSTDPMIRSRSRPHAADPADHARADRSHAADASASRSRRFAETMPAVSPAVTMRPVTITVATPTRTPIRGLVRASASSPSSFPCRPGHGNRRFPPGRPSSNPGMTSSNQSSWPCAPMVTTPAAGPRSTPAAAGRAGRTGADGTCRRARAGRVRTRPACRGPGRTG